MPSDRPQTRFSRHLIRRLRWDEIDPDYLRKLVAIARAEDMQALGLRQPPATTGDVSTASLPQDLPPGQACLTARHPMRIAGLPLVPLILETYGGGTWTPELEDGDEAAAGQILGTLQGPVHTLLNAERIILNFLQHLSGIASHTARHVAALGQSSTRLLDTRKTTPGYRLLEKYAVACGGGWNHRLGLYDRVMLKDNHLASSQAGAGERLAQAVSQARERNPDLPIEVEVDHLDQIPPVLKAGADVILLDNFSAENLSRAITLIQGQALTEASGGITLQSLPALARLGLDFISCGALIHQSTWVDIGMDWVGVDC